MSSELLCLGYTQSNTVDVHVRGSVLHLSAFVFFAALASYTRGPELSVMVERRLGF